MFFNFSRFILKHYFVIYNTKKKQRKIIWLRVPNLTKTNFRSMECILQSYKK